MSATNPKNDAFTNDSSPGDSKRPLEAKEIRGAASSDVKTIAEVSAFIKHVLEVMQNPEKDFRSDISKSISSNNSLSTSTSTSTNNSLERSARSSKTTLGSDKEDTKHDNILRDMANAALNDSVYEESDYTKLLNYTYLKEYLAHNMHLINERDENGMTVLMHVCKEARLISYKICDDSANSLTGFTEIYKAKSTNLALAKLLLDFGADPNVVSTIGNIPFYNERTIPFNGNANSYFMPISVDQADYGSRANSTETRTVISYPLEETRGSGYTPLMFAAYNLNYEMVYLLLTNGAKPNQPMGLYDNAEQRMRDIIRYHGDTLRSNPVFNSANNKDMAILKATSVTGALGFYRDETTQLQKFSRLRARMIQVNTEMANILPRNLLNLTLEYAAPPFTNCPITGITPSLILSDKVELPNFKVHVLASKTQFLGDRSHALELSQAFGSNCLIPPKFQEYDPATTDCKQLYEKMCAEKQYKHIVIGVGTIGLEHLPKFKRKATFEAKPIDNVDNVNNVINNDNVVNDNIMTVWSGHQYLDKLAENVQFLDFIGLPEYEAHLIRHPRKFSAHGVPHEATPEVREQRFKQFEHLFDHSKPCIGILLGGAAPTRSNQTIEFTPNCARELASHIYKEFRANYAKYKKPEYDIENLNIYVSTGPRTSPEVINAFKAALLSQGIKEKQLKILDFANHKGASTGLLEFIRFNNQDKSKPESRLIVTADSISMGTAAYETLQPGTVTFAEIDSMSDAHHAFLEYYRQLKLVHIMKYNKQQAQLEPEPKVDIANNTVNTVSASPANTSKTKPNINTITYTHEQLQKVRLWNDKYRYAVEPRSAAESLGLQLHSKISSYILQLKNTAKKTGTPALTKRQ